MNLQSVKSSNLQAVGYDKASKTMRVLFQEGSMYDYFNVPEKVHDALMEADSLGSFFQQNIIGRYRFEKLNLREEGNNTMGKNKQQAAAEQRAAKSATQATTPTAEQPKPAVQPATPAVATTLGASKQQATFDKLKAAWAEKKVDLSKMTATPDGKFLNVVVAEGWPTVRIGNSGGITVMELRSYASAFDAAVDGLALYQKQQGRDSKKSALPAPAAAAPAPAPAAAAPKLEEKATPTQRKKKQDAAVEAQLQASA